MVTAYIEECCKQSDRGSIGAWYVYNALERAGHHVDRGRKAGRQYDVELLSIHHSSDLIRLATRPQHARIRIVGGHPMQSNPRPAFPFADVVFIGEGEQWIVEAFERLGKSLDVKSLEGMDGVVVPSRGCDVPPGVFLDPLPSNPPYLNRPGTRSAAWYVEMARGCRFNCSFCELGHSSPFRIYSKDHLMGVIDDTDCSVTRKINFYAPDEASHPDYVELLHYLQEKGFAAGFSSMRLESILKGGTFIPIRSNVLIRIGLDGLTEKTRRKVKKPITNDNLVEYFDRLIQHGHVQFKMFLIVGYPWEKVADFDEFEWLMDQVGRLPYKKNVSLRIKWTPLVPQLCTPLRDVDPQYDYEMVDRILGWHHRARNPNSEPGMFIRMDGGVLSEENHALQVKLAGGNESVWDDPTVKRAVENLNRRKGNEA